VSTGLEVTSADPAGDTTTPSAAAAEVAVATHGLTKRFRGGQLAVDGLDMVVPRGAVYGFLGPNGSGKTTTIRMLLGLVYPTSGSHELLATAMPSGAARVLPRVGSRPPTREPLLPASPPRWSGWACWPPRRSVTAPTRSA